MASWRHGFGEPGDVREIRLLVDTVPTLAWSARPDGSADFFNQRWLDYTGLSAKQALDSGWQVAIHPDDLPRILKTFREALNSVEPLEVEGRFRRFDGEFRWFLFRGSPMRDRSGKSRSGTEQIPILRSASVLKKPFGKARSGGDPSLRIRLSALRTRIRWSP
jgi:PAS domain S-box-containing protein